jgi:DNA-binding HxlR family transcriptional regulator
MSKTKNAKYSYNGLERVLHEKARLSIMISLFTKKQGCNFNELKDLCGLTDGNLSRHLQILKDDGLIEILKTFNKNKPNTLCKITKHGKDRFLEYIVELEKVVKDAVGELKNEDYKEILSPNLKTS